MKIDELLDKFRIDPEKDIVPNFRLSKTIEEDVSGNDYCLNCRSRFNVFNLLSPPWTRVQCCSMCRHINVIYYSDKMAGITKDLIKCFVEK